MLLNDLTDHRKALMFVAYLMDGDQCVSLFNQLPPKEKEEILQAYNEFSKKTPDSRKKKVVREIRQLVQKGRVSQLGDIHSDWIVEALKTESPRMIAVILRHLPGEKVRAILDQLPDSILSQMPSLTETFSLNVELADLLHEVFEDQFRFSESSGKLDSDQFDFIPSLRGEKISALFRRLGLRELQIAFQGLNDDTMNLILRRITPQDAALLKEGLKKKIFVSEVRLKKAQSNILSLDLQSGDPNSLVLEVGFYVYTKALTVYDEEAIKRVEMNFPIRLSEVLRKYAKRNIAHHALQTAMKYQAEILNEMKGL